MPTYEYECPKCGVFEATQRITEPAFEVCPTCASPVKRLVSGAAFHLKGSGWYKTDYPSSGNAGKGGGSGEASKKAETASEAKAVSEAKPSSDAVSSTSSKKPD